MNGRGITIVTINDGCRIKLNCIDECGMDGRGNLNCIDDCRIDGCRVKIEWTDVELQLNGL